MNDGASLDNSSLQSRAGSENQRQFDDVQDRLNKCENGDRNIRMRMLRYVTIDEIQLQFPKRN